MALNMNALKVLLGFLLIILFFTIIKNNGTFLAILAAIICLISGLKILIDGFVHKSS